MMVIRAGGTAPASLALDLERALRAYEVAVRGVVRLPRRARGSDGDAAKAQFIDDMKRLRELRDRVVELRKIG